MSTLPTIQQAARDIASGQTTPLALVDDCLRRIDQLESRVRAWVLVDADNARRQARRCADEIATNGPKSLLHGIPIGIKDIIDVAGWPTKAGSPLRERIAAASEDAPIVTRLRQAGAILLGKTVTTEFASFDPPPTRNPWNLERTPAGSSSGSAAAVATGMCIGAMGSQTGGSITRPASYCGVAGCKPTYGLVCLDGIVPLSFHMDHPGPIARGVADLAILLEVIADPSEVTFGAQRVPPNYSAQLEAGHAPRLAILEDYFVEKAAPAVREVFVAAVEKLRSAGAITTRAALPAGFDRVHKLHRRIMAVEAAEVQRGYYPEQEQIYGRQIAALLREAHQTTLLDYVAALRHQQQYRRDVLALFRPHVDAVIMPATTSTAPGLETTGDPAFNSPWSYSGLPVVSIPCGLASDGLPVSVQLVGSPLSEGPLLATARWCEQALAVDLVPPIVDAA